MNTPPPDTHSPTLPHDDDAHHSPEAIIRQMRFYIGIFCALLVLTFVTVGVSKIHIGPPDSNVGNITVGLLIATVKASLVAAFFMHLSTEKKLVLRILVFTVAFAAALMFLSLLAFFDPIQIKP